MATKPHRTSRIARLARIAIAVAGMALGTASWASITSSENPSTDGSYTVSWSAVPNAHQYQLYEDGTLVYDSTGTSWSFSGKAAGDYEYTVGFCEFIFDEEMCYGSGYTALTVTVSSAPPPTPAPTVRATFGESSITRGESVTLTWSSTNATRCSGSPAIGSTATSGTKTYTPSSAGSFEVTVTCAGAGGSADDIASVTVYERPTVRASFDQSSITLGESVTLTWLSSNASACSGSPSIGSAATSGTKRYTPSSTGSFSVTVTCTGAGGSADDRDSVTVNAPPPPPALTVPATDADGTYDATWTSPSGATSYELQEKVGSGAWSASETLTTTTKSYTGKTPAIYKYRVRACAGSGACGDWSSTGTTKVPPRAPRLTVPATDADGSYPVRWTSPSGATSYELQEKVGSGGWSASETLTTTTKSYPGKTPAIYKYRVRACAGSGNCGDWSSTGTTKVPPRAPRLTVPATDADGSYPVRWTSPSGATSYELQEKVGSSAWSASETLTTTTKSYPGKTPAIYKYRVRACAGSGNCGNRSSTGTTKVPPRAPRLTVPATDADGSYPVRWRSPSGATSYELQEKAGSWSFRNIYRGYSTSRNITGKADGTYSYQVRACAGTGNCGRWSSTESVEVSINNAPVAVDDTAETPFVTAVEIPVLANDTDADGDDLTVTVVTTPADGTATITSDADGNDTLVTYTPDSGHPGEDTFDYTVFDGTATDTGTVTVTVNRVKVTPNPSTTGSYTLSWDGSALLADRYRVLESGAAGDPPLLSYHLWTSVGYTGKATGEYHYVVERCEEPLGELEECVEYGRATAEVILPITPGNLPYRSGVTKGGDAYVNVPIAPVPGVNGLAPRLSIDYSGGRERHRADQELPADMIGYGWRVGGFSTIRRCVKGTDDSDGISFNDEDALCLDGEPLTKIKDRHPESPAEYRTARESFAKVVPRDSATGDWFEVHLPDGTVREYGSTADSQLWKPAREVERHRAGRAGGGFPVVDQQADGRVRQRHDVQVLRGRHQAGAASEENHLRRRGRRDDRVRLQAAGRPGLDAGGKLLPRPAATADVHPFAARRIAGARLPAGVQENQRRPSAPERAADLRLRTVRRVPLSVAAGDRLAGFRRRNLGQRIDGPHGGGDELHDRDAKGN